MGGKGGILGFLVLLESKVEEFASTILGRSVVFPEDNLENIGFSDLVLYQTAMS